MTDNELRLQVALALGYQFERMFTNKPRAYMMLPGSLPTPGDEMRTGDEVRWESSDPNWPGNIADAYAMEETIPTEQRSEYVKALIAVIAEDCRDAGESSNFWMYFHATPQQRCRAFLAWHAATRATVAPCPRCGGAMRQHKGGWTCDKCE